MQSGCDKILGLMKRKYNLREMEHFFADAVDSVPEICLGTDMLTGFPGESEADFDKTCETFMKFCIVMYLHIPSGRELPSNQKTISQCIRDGREVHASQIIRIKENGVAQEF